MGAYFDGRGGGKWYQHQPRKDRITLARVSILEKKEQPQDDLEAIQREPGRPESGDADEVLQST